MILDKIVDYMLEEKILKPLNNKDIGVGKVLYNISKKAYTIYELIDHVLVVSIIHIIYKSVYKLSGFLNCSDIVREVLEDFKPCLTLLFAIPITALVVLCTMKKIEKMRPDLESLCVNNVNKLLKLYRACDIFYAVVIDILYAIIVIYNLDVIEAMAFVWYKFHWSFIMVPLIILLLTIIMPITNVVTQSIKKII